MRSKRTWQKRISTSTWSASWRIPEFRKRFEEADRAWDIALQLSALRKARGLTQQQVADLLGTKQQAIARLEDPSYTGHSLSMVKKYAEALGATVQVTITLPDGIGHEG